MGIDMEWNMDNCLNTLWNLCWHTPCLYLKSMLYENLFTIPDLIFTVYDDLQTHHSKRRTTDNSYSGSKLIILKEIFTYEKVL